MGYLVGLMASDGCLYKDGRHLEFTSMDLELAQNFCKALGRPITVKRKLNSDDSTAYRVQFSDVALYDFLIDVGLTAAKSNTIGPLHIPDEFYVDFLRGEFEGDGSTYGYYDTRWKNSWMYYVQIVSASKDFLDWVILQNIRIIGLSAASPRISGRVWQVSYGKKDAGIFFANVYGNSTLFLERKRSKLEGFILRT